MKDVYTSKINFFQTIGDECRKWRVASGIKIEDVAKVFDYTKWAVYKFEQGKTNTMCIYFSYVSLGMTPLNVHVR